MTPAAALRAVPATLVTGAAGAAREAAIAAILGDGSSCSGTNGTNDALCAVLLEGLPDGRAALNCAPLAPSPTLLVERIAPGCLCCTGNLILRVTLNRILRRRPARLFIALASTEHLDQLRSWLRQPPYDQLLELTPDLRT